MRNLLLALLLAAPAWAGSQKSAPNIPSGAGVPAVPSLTVPALQTGAPALRLDPSAAHFMREVGLAVPNLLDANARRAMELARTAVLPGRAPGGAGVEPVLADAASPAAQPAAPQGAAPTARAQLDQVARRLAIESLAEATLDPLPGHTYHPSPADWRDETLYSVMIDRFASAGERKTHGDPKKGDTRHGGNLKGLKEKMSYVPGTTVVLSPVTKSLPEAYHNYAPINLLEVEPHFGTMQDMKEAVAEAHEVDKRVVLDIVINHAGPVFEYEGGPSGSGWSPLDQPRKNIGYWTEDLKPSELKDPERFTMRGVINNWDDHHQSQYGDFPPNYRHFRTDEAKTQEMLIHVAKWWIKETDIDGFRLDAIRHVDPGFLRRFRVEIKEYAASLGKEKFLLLGENSTGVDEELAGNFKLGLDSVYNYPEYRRVNFALHGKAPAAELKRSVEKAIGVLGSAVGRAVRFIDLHDTYRFLRTGEDVSVLKTGLVFLMFSIGIPLLYYGTEQAFRQNTQRLEPENGQHPADPQNREDMFADGEFKSESSAGDKFDPLAETYLWTKTLVDLRAKHAALRRGEHWVRWADEGAAGLYAFSRIHQGEEVVVALNTGEGKRGESVWIDANLHKPGDVFVDELDPAFETTAVSQEGGGVKLYVDVPARGSRVLVRKA